MSQYVRLEISGGSYTIACPDPDCPRDGEISLSELERLVGPEQVERHRQHRLDTEVALDVTRAWCPTTDCQTICHVCPQAELENLDMFPSFSSQVLPCYSRNSLCHFRVSEFILL